MSKRTIKKIAVWGSGVMGSRIAAHFAGIGLHFYWIWFPKIFRQMQNLQKEIR